jgi:hypothetical protein
VIDELKADEMLDNGMESVKDGKWHHVVGTYDGKRACLYIDGNLSDFTNINGNIATNDNIVVIGDKPEWPRYNWNGLIDDVHIYSYTLSAEEVKDLYEGKEPPLEKKSE